MSKLPITKYAILGNIMCAEDIIDILHGHFSCDMEELVSGILKIQKPHPVSFIIANCRDWSDKHFVNNLVSQSLHMPL